MNGLNVMGKNCYHKHKYLGGKSLYKASHKVDHQGTVLMNFQICFIAHDSWKMNADGWTWFHCDEKMKCDEHVCNVVIAYQPWMKSG
jgi:hypothetical protein